MMGKELIQCKNYNNALVCEMQLREMTCSWLDELLNDRAFKKKYAVKDHSHQHHVPKMKIYIDVAQIARQ